MKNETHTNWKGFALEIEQVLCVMSADFSYRRKRKENKNKKRENFLRSCGEVSDSFTKMISKFITNFRFKFLRNRLRDLNKSFDQLDITSIIPGALKIKRRLIPEKTNEQLLLTIQLWKALKANHLIVYWSRAKESMIDGEAIVFHISTQHVRSFTS